jgi:hypothetical protein
MPQLKVGLAPKAVSFYDPLTNTYITLDRPVQTIEYDASTDLSRIAHAILCQYPALVLYEGKLPQAVVDAWKAKYDKWAGPQAKKRADDIQARTPDTVTPGGTQSLSGAVEENPSTQFRPKMEGEAEVLDLDGAAEAEIQEEESAEAEVQSKPKRRSSNK